MVCIIGKVKVSLIVSIISVADWSSRVNKAATPVVFVASSVLRSILHAEKIASRLTSKPVLRVGSCYMYAGSLSSFITGEKGFNKGQLELRYLVRIDLQLQH